MLKVARVVQRLRLDEHGLDKVAVRGEDGVGGRVGQAPVAHQEEAAGAAGFSRLEREEERLKINSDTLIAVCTSSVKYT